MLRKSSITLVLAAILVLVMASASFASPGNGKGKWKIKVQANWKATQLTDVGSHWAKQPVRFMLTQGIVAGYPDFTFRPNNPVTKYEAIMMIARASGFDGTADQDLELDESVPDWMRECMDYAVEEGILTEAEADNFKGWEPAKRYQVAVWAARTIGLEEDDQTSFLDDDEIPYFARSYIGGMCKHRFMVGYPDKKFQPNKPVTRAEMAAIIYRIMLSEIEGDGNDDSDTSDDLEIDTLTPADGSDDVDPATDQLTAKFSVAIEASEDLASVREGITVKNVTDDDYIDIDQVSISGRYLYIELEDELEDDKTYRVTIDEDIIEAEESGESFDGLSGSQWEFSTGDAEEDDFDIVSLSPADGDDDVDGANTEVLRAEFSDDIQVISGKDLDNAAKVYNKSEDEYVDIDSIEIDGDTLIITLEEPLAEGDTFEVTIKADYLEEVDSGDNFEGITGSDWRFETN
ncbi:MAG: S-layer homology domain-containing protein [Desulfotomaculaceae bacterium]